MSWEVLPILIPLIILTVTILFNLFKERRDRNYQYRPIATMYTITNIMREHHDENTYILYNDNVLQVDVEEEGVFLQITNITKPPMLNVLIDIHYNNGDLIEKYQVFLIEKQKSFIIPLSGIIQRNQTTCIRENFDRIIITYRSLSGQKYIAKIMSTGKTTIIAKKFLFGRETILSTKSNRINEFRRL